MLAGHMRIGVPKEIKTQEFRVGMTPSGVATLVARGHNVLVEQGAPEGTGFFWSTPGRIFALSADDLSAVQAAAIANSIR